MRGVGRKLFPVGLYASLLVALLALLRPQLVAPVESWLSTAAALPFRAYGEALPRDANAASAVIERSSRRVGEFWRRVEAREAALWPAVLMESHEPVVCRVLACDLASGVMRLDATGAELAGVEPFVTAGDALVGFLSAGREPRVAEVELLASSARAAATRGVPASIEIDGHPLRFVAERSASIDPWPLRAALIDDPYRAASLQRDGFPVFTTGFADDPLGAIPPQLRIGSFRIWGYERGGRRLPIGFFVDPVAVDDVVVVTCWRRTRAASRGALAHRELARVPLSAYSLTTTGSRWFARVGFEHEPISPGTPVVRGDRFVGRVTSGGLGYAFVTPLGVVGDVIEAWSVPADGEPSTVRLRVIVSDAAEIGLRVDRGVAQSGALFTTTAHGLPGLWLGDAELGPQRATLVVARAAAPSAGGLAALVDTEVMP